MAQDTSFDVSWAFVVRCGSLCDVVVTWLPVAATLRRRCATWLSCVVLGFVVDLLSWSSSSYPSFAVPRAVVCRLSYPLLYTFVVL
jgi:hypothetical protein